MRRINLTRESRLLGTGRDPARISFRGRSPFRIAGFQFGKGTDLTLKVPAFRLTPESSDLLNTVWSKDIQPYGKEQRDRITITDC